MYKKIRNVFPDLKDLFHFELIIRFLKLGH